jgi:hypothetical protein
MSRLIDEFGNDLGHVIETDSTDSTDPGTRAYTVYVDGADAPAARTGPPPSRSYMLSPPWRGVHDITETGPDGQRVVAAGVPASCAVDVLEAVRGAYANGQADSATGREPS